jgi:hypothetical protein
MEMTLLEQQQQQLGSDVTAAQQRLDQANQALNQAVAAQQQGTGSSQSLGSGRDVRGDGSYHTLGANSEAFMQAQMAVNKARSDLTSAQSHFQQVRSQLDLVTQKLTELKSIATAEHVATSTNTEQTTASAPAPAPTSTVIADLPGPLADIVNWVRKNYMALAIIGLGLVYVMSRFAKG